MDLKELILGRIKDEIENDPYKIGYKTKTDEEILDLLNHDIDIPIVVNQKMVAPINRILSGIQSAPNIISLNDVIESKNVKAISKEEVVQNV